MSESGDELAQRALGHERRGDWEGAAELYRRLADSHPTSAEAHHNLARALRATGRAGESLAAAGAAARLRPEHPTIRNSLGLSLEAVGYIDDAAEAYRATLALDPNHAAATINLGRLLVARDAPAEAVALLEPAAHRAPDDPGVAINLANALLGVGRASEAEARLQQVTAAAGPVPPQAFNSLGIAHYVRRDFAGAADAFVRAVAAQPNFAEAHENLAQALLQLGRYREAWQEYDWRWRNPSNALTKRNLGGPLWDGRPLTGRTLLLLGEQGFGDTLQFVRYAAMVPKDGGRIVLACPEALLRILARVPEIDSVHPLDDPLPAFDCAMPLMSLPAVFDTTVETIPDPSPYLFAEPAADLVASGAGPRPVRIGIAWAGRPRHEADPHRNRSCAADRFAPIARRADVRLFSLQTGPGAAELAQLVAAADGTPIHDLGPRIEDFADTAALVAAMDLVITVDTALAHLAGAMGRPVWVLPPYAADWRWRGHADGAQPWYRSARVFPQRAPGDWAGTFASVEAALHERLSGDEISQK